MKKIRKTFTLVELLVVIAILGILTSITIVGYSTYTSSGREIKAQSELKQIITIVEDPTSEVFSIEEDDGTNKLICTLKTAVTVEDNNDTDDEGTPSDSEKAEAFAKFTSYLSEDDDAAKIAGYVTSTTATYVVASTTVSDVTTYTITGIKFESLKYQRSDSKSYATYNFDTLEFATATE